ncbi:hypothetical protein ACCC88_03225 [Sphingomonas sp. Sphisp140]|uniref:hypothetical protein n=1 Tax=unclassified Sphingomonas TaxID=196159 RepID=UPI0039AEEF2E
MTHHVPGEPGPQDFRENAEHSRDAGTADESAGNANAATSADAERQDADGIPQTGEEDPLAQVSDGESSAGAAEFARGERADASGGSVDGSYSIEPGHIRGSAEDIVAGGTGPGPSG